MNFEEYLSEHLDKGLIDFSIRAQKTDTGITFYIHPDGKDGGTQDYKVDGNQLTTLGDWGK